MKPADVVFMVGLEAFCKRYPYDEWPEWLKGNAVPSVTPLTKTRWRYRITVPLAGPLDPHESWEGEGDSRMLIYTDPETGARRVIISKGAAGHLDVFEAEIDFVSSEIDIKRIESPTSLEIPPGLYLWGMSA